jgi:DNA-binding transcriptional LysR family regulator
LALKAGLSHQPSALRASAFMVESPLSHQLHERQHEVEHLARVDPSVEDEIDQLWQIRPHRRGAAVQMDMRKGQLLAFAVNGSLLLDELELVIQAALAGAGLAWAAEDRVAEHLESGAFVRVLEDWCPPFPGFFLYYPTRKQHPAALTALITTLRLET